MQVKRFMRRRSLRNLYRFHFEELLDVWLDGLEAGRVVLECIDKL